MTRVLQRPSAITYTIVAAILPVTDFISHGEYIRIRVTVRVLQRIVIKMYNALFVRYN